jgi:hypothetical protein
MNLNPLLMLFTFIIEETVGIKSYELLAIQTS